MKIQGGKFKGRNIFMPKDIRPTQNVARMAIFDLIGHDLEGVEFLELFAGSGAVGLEALSRGAAHCTFVEREEKCVDVITENLGRLDIATTDAFLTHSKAGRYNIVQADVFASIKQLAAEKAAFDIVFVDPPYGRELAKKALKTLEGYDILHANSTIIFQHDKKEPLPEVMGRFLLVKRKNYGSTVLSIYQIQ